MRTFGTGTRQSLADARRRLIAAGIPLDGASDHGVSEALYLRDPDQNGIELYWIDRRLSGHPRLHPYQTNSFLELPLIAQVNHLPINCSL